jgi:hypothetical protein
LQCVSVARERLVGYAEPLAAQSHDDAVGFMSA